MLLWYRASMQKKGVLGEIQGLRDVVALCAKRLTAYP